MFTFATGSDKDLKIRNAELVRVTGIDAVRRHLEHVLLSVQGDWFESDTDGIPYLEGSSPEVLVARIKAAALTVPDLLEVTDLQWRASGNTLTISVLRFRTRTGAEGALASLNIATG